MTCYIPPISCGLDIAILDNFLKSVENLFICDSSIVILGDFNMPNIVWSPDVLMPLEYHGVYDSTFTEFITQHALLQYVHSPTRCNNILDLVFCDDPYSICNLKITHPFSTIYIVIIMLLNFNFFVVISRTVNPSVPITFQSTISKKPIGMEWLKRCQQ